MTHTIARADQTGARALLPIRASLRTRISAVVEAPAELRVLAGFELCQYGNVIRLPYALQRVLVFLAVHHRVLHRPYVAGSLWPEVPEARAHGNLRSALWRLRGLDPEVVDTTLLTVGLRPEVRIDVSDRIEEARRLAGRAPDDLVRLAADLEAEFLPDWYDDWLIEWRERWRQIRLHALEEIARALIAAGRFGPAIEAGLAAVRAEPLRESAHRAVIHAHLAEGNDGEALRHFRDYARLIERELGIEPSPRITALVASVMHP